MIHLDTNTAIAVMNDRPRIVADRLAHTLGNGEAVALSSVAVFELWFGVEKGARSKRQANIDQLARLLASPIDVLPFDEDDARTAAEIRATLRAAGTPIGPYDLLIAAQALRHGATLVTANCREFDRVPGLKVEDWGRE